MYISISEILPDEQPALANLIKMYCYEWSQYNLFDVDEQGVYPFEKYVNLCFEKPKHYNNFIRVDGILAGFALIDDDFAVSKESDYSMGEFFVMYKYRRFGVGKYAATYLFDRYPGKWEIGFHPNNTNSVKFWTNILNDYTHYNYTLHSNCTGLTYHDGSLGNVITFDNRDICMK